ncbi:MAG: efflux transporter outer membrane subunit [Burkholderiaceae bacterium]|nr:efflux transporter outer membrane subunit [Burkholderiaceae bacterium]
MEAIPMHKPAPFKPLFSLLAVSAAALLAGCSMVPPYERPAAPIATQWPGAAANAANTTAVATTATAAADIDWRDFFHDAQLQQLIDLALANNRDLRIAVLNIEQARAQYRIQRADQLPSVGLSLSQSRQNPSNSGEGISSVAVGGLALNAFELDLFGRVRALSDAAQASYLASAEARKTVQINLIASVANNYLSWLADNELLALTHDTLGTREASLKLTQLRFDNGVASELDCAQSRALHEAARATLAQVQRQRALNENALVLLIGQPLPADLPTRTTRLSSAALLADVPAGLPSDLLERRPDIRQAEQQLLAANANIGAARAAFFPRISLTGSIGRASTELTGLFSSNDSVNAWSWTAQLVAPLFDAGRNQAGLEATQAKRDIAVAQYEKTIQSAFREVADALAGRTTLGEQLTAQKAQATAQANAFRLADLRYRNGVANYLDVLDAQRALFSTQQAVTQTALLQRQNQVVLYKALGGGWSKDTQRCASSTPCLDPAQGT